MSGLRLLNAGCGTHYASGWVNCDVWVSESTRPDVRVVAGEPYPFGDGSFDAVFLGHVLEHVDWCDVPGFLLDMRRLLVPGGHLLVVGPDVFRTIRRWAEGREPWEMVLSTLEHQDVNWQSGRSDEFWDGATHHWNCHLDRVLGLLEGAGFVGLEDYSDVIPNDTSMRWWVEPSSGIRWPVVAKWFWQFAVKARVPV